MAGEERWTERGINSPVGGNPPRPHPEPATHAGFANRLGSERMLFNARAAIERFQAMQVTPGGSVSPPGA